jgi:hypothetical protein
VRVAIKVIVGVLRPDLISFAKCYKVAPQKKKLPPFNLYIATTWGVFGCQIKVRKKGVW